MTRAPIIYIYMYIYIYCGLGWGQAPVSFVELQLKVRHVGEEVDDAHACMHVVEAPILRLGMGPGPRRLFI